MSNYEMVYGRIKIQYIQRGKDIKLNVFSYKSQLKYACMMLASIVYSLL